MKFKNRKKIETKNKNEDFEKFEKFEKIGKIENN